MTVNETDSIVQVNSPSSSLSRCIKNYVLGFSPAADFSAFEYVELVFREL